MVIRDSIEERMLQMLGEKTGVAEAWLDGKGVDKQGKFIALRTDWICDSGAYLSQAGVLTNSMNGLTIGAGAYRVEALYGRHRQVMTNTAPTNAYRGAGRPEAAYIVERLVDEAAVALGIDPWELRRRNVIRKEEMPYKTLTGAVFDSAENGVVPVSRTDRALTGMTSVLPDVAPAMFAEAA